MLRMGVNLQVSRTHLLNGYKWCMRVHVLEVGAPLVAYPEGASCYLHGKVVCVCVCERVSE
jgi:hypothetical protein